MLDFPRDQSGSRPMSMPDLLPTLDPKDALEARLRLSVLASSLIEHAHVLCVDVELQQLPAYTTVLQGYLRDASALASAMEVLSRRGMPPNSGRPASTG